jgi:leader peptidase (prepilin peptidase)/N-methyltransferase
MSILYSLIFFVLGLITGSFLSSFTYRVAVSDSVARGRSYCPKCKKTIVWYDNIPVLSFLLLSGKCRNCGKNISKRYPIIEISTGLLFLITYQRFNGCGILGIQNYTASPFCDWRLKVGYIALPYFLTLFAALIAVFVIDFENEIIIDQITFFLIALTVFLLVIFSPSRLYLALFSGFLASSFLLLLNMVTRGKGMGLGDVKLAIPLGIVIFSVKAVVLWLFLSFLIGAVVGVLLIILGKANFGRHIAFAPFLVISFICTLFFADTIINSLFPYL